MPGRRRTTAQQRLQELLRELRKDASLTQVELATRLSKPQSYVSKYESGERQLSLPEIEEICDALDVSLLTFVRRYQKK